MVHKQGKNENNKIYKFQSQQRSQQQTSWLQNTFHILNIWRSKINFVHVRRWILNLTCMVGEKKKMKI